MIKNLNNINLKTVDGFGYEWSTFDQPTISDYEKRFISQMPKVRYIITQVIAIFICWPLARTARVLEKIGLNVDMLSLSAHRHNTFYTMRADSFDCFATRLEQQFTHAKIQKSWKNQRLNIPQKHLFGVGWGIKNLVITIKVESSS